MTSQIGYDCLECRDAGQVPDPYGWGDDADWLPCPARCESTVYREHCHECACGVDLDAPHGLCACGAVACDSCSDPHDIGAPWTCPKCKIPAVERIRRQANCEEHPLLDELSVGSAEPFCACGRRWSQCDRSRLGCTTRRAS